MVKCVEWIECRTCHAKINHSAIALEPGDEIEVVMRIVGKCVICKKAEARTTNGPKRKLPPAL